MKQIFPFPLILSLCLLAFLTSCTPEKHLLEGTWERIGDPFVGVRTKITYENEQLKGNVVFIPDNRQALRGYEMGELLWKSFEQVSENEYQCKEVYREDWITHTEFAGYEPVRITLINPDKFHVNVIGRTEANAYSIFAEWIRVKK